MNVEVWLEQIGKLDEMINDKLAEREEVLAMAARLNPNMDGMPHGSGDISDPVGNGAIKLVMLAREIDNLIDQYVDIKSQVNCMLKELPANERLVLHKYYIKYMTIADIAKSMKYSTRQIARFKEQGLKNLENVLACQA